MVRASLAGVQAMVFIDGAAVGERVFEAAQTFAEVCAPSHRLAGDGEGEG